MSIKPMLADDYDEAKLKFPSGVQPKVDGVRALNMSGYLTGRSLKKFANKYVTRLFSIPELIGFDGEMAVDDPTHPELCSLTTSALNTKEGEPHLFWWVFDFVTEETEDLPYSARYAAMIQRVETLINSPDTSWLKDHLRIMPMEVVSSIARYLDLEDEHLDAGYEGSIIRGLQNVHKQGRSTIREGGLLRAKRFIDAEAVVEKINEGFTNMNEAQKNELGQTFRTTHQENMVPNGMIGSMDCRLIKDVVYRSRGQDVVLFRTGELVRVAPGTMKHDDRARFFREQELILGKISKFQLFPKGSKDKPRFPTHQVFRDPVDM